MRFEYVDTDGNRDSELLYLKFILCALLISPPERTVWTLPRNDWWARDLFDVTIFVGSKRRRTCLCLGCHGDRMTLPFIGSRSDSRFCRRGYF